MSTEFADVNALVVEDDAGGMAIIGVMMRYLGIKAYINTSGQGVVEMAHAMKPMPNMIFLDINLPRTSGYEILKQIRADAFSTHGASHSVFQMCSSVPWIIVVPAGP